MVQTRRRRRNMSRELERRIESEASGGRSAKDIFEEMPSWPEYDPDKPVILRTVQNVVHDAAVRDQSGPWSPNDAKDGAFLYTPEDARLVLDMFADQVTGLGRKRPFSKEAAKWVLRLRRLAPDLRLWMVGNLVADYMAAESRRESTEALDALLAFQPWKSKNRLENYVYACEQGWVKELPQYRFMLMELYRNLANSKKEIPHNRADDEATETQDFHELGFRAYTDLWYRRAPELLRIREENPRLFKRIQKAGEEAQERERPIADKWLRDKRRWSRKDLLAFYAECRSKWDEYNRLIDSFNPQKASCVNEQEEGEGK